MRAARAADAPVLHEVGRHPMRLGLNPRGQFAASPPGLGRGLTAPQSAALGRLNRVCLDERRGRRDPRTLSRPRPFPRVSRASVQTILGEQVDRTGISKAPPRRNRWCGKVQEITESELREGPRVCSEPSFVRIIAEKLYFSTIPWSGSVRMIEIERDLPWAGLFEIRDEFRD
jgi:hypothetical protein